MPYSGFNERIAVSFRHIMKMRSLTIATGDSKNCQACHLSANPPKQTKIRFPQFLIAHILKYYIKLKHYVLKRFVMECLTQIMDTICIHLSQKGC